MSWEKKQKEQLHEQRNFVAKNMKKSGQGAHRDKKNDYNRQKFKLAKDDE